MKDGIAYTLNLESNVQSQFTALENSTTKEGEKIIETNRDMSDFLVVDGKMFILYHSRTTTTVPCNSTSELQTGRALAEPHVTTENVYRIKVVNLKSAGTQADATIADFLAKDQTYQDEGN